MNQQELVQQVNVAIKKWLQETDKLVVAIDGYTGIGKTTLLNNLVSINSDIVAVNRDDFLLPRTTVEKLLEKSADQSKIFELQINDNKKLENLVTAFRDGQKLYRTQTHDPISGRVDIPKEFDISKKIMVIEGVFMFHPKLINHLWDKRIYLEGDISKIDERRIKREKEKWGKDYFPETHPDSHFKQVIIALKRYKKMYHPEKSADLVLQVDC